VRREDAFTVIKSGPSVQQYSDQLEHAIVPDNAAEDAYDEALAGAKYVVHIAGAWPMPVSGPLRCESTKTNEIVPPSR
jgi:hypothetical protein